MKGQIGRRRGRVSAPIFGRLKARLPVLVLCIAVLFVQAAFIVTPAVVHADDFEQELNAQGFPESYKQALRQIHAQYPAWTFTADHTGVSWNALVTGESVYGRNLIHYSRPTSWKSRSTQAFNYEADEWYGFDGSSWVQASDEAIGYFLDPRTYLDSTHIFAFQQLAYTGRETQSNVNNILSGTFMENAPWNLTYEGRGISYAEAFCIAGEQSGVSPYHLATRARNELGVSGSGSVSGTEPGYEGYYNYFNWKAVTGGGRTAIQNGLVFAIQQGWNSRMTAIIGGAKLLGRNYITRSPYAQNTLYYEKFDIHGFWHQYMTNVEAPYGESKSAAAAYSETVKQNTAFEFVIPIFDDMPDTALSRPSGDGDPNDTLDGIRVGNSTLTPSFDRFTDSYTVIVPNSTSSVEISAQKASDSASVSGEGTYDLHVGRNTIVLSVTSEYGTQRTYTIRVTRKDADGSASSGDSVSAGSLVVSGGFVTGVQPGTKYSEVVSKVDAADVKIFSESGQEKTAGDLAATGDRLELKNDSGETKLTLTMRIRGDVNEDGQISIFDVIQIKNIILGKKTPTSAQRLAADANWDGNVSILDIIAVKNHILQKRTIRQ